MSQYLSAISNKLQTMLNNLTGKYTKKDVKSALRKGTYDKINKELENYFIREGMAQVISKQQEFANKLIAVEGFLYDGLHGNLMMQLRSHCDADDSACLGNNLNVAADMLKDHIEEAFKILHKMMGRPENEFISPDEDARIMFLVELLCSNQPIEYRTSVSGNLNNLIQEYCQFSPEVVPTFKEPVQPLSKRQRFAVPGGPSIRMVPGKEAITFNINAEPMAPPKNIWSHPPAGGKKVRKSRRKRKNSRGKKSRRKTAKRGGYKYKK